MTFAKLFRRSIYPLAVISCCLGSVACDKDEDDSVDTSSGDCELEFVSATQKDDTNFVVRLKNNSSGTRSLAVNVLYSKNGVQIATSGLGVGQSVTAGTTVDVETLPTGDLARADYDCARIRVQVLTPGSGVPCEAGQVGKDCY